jgi:predicted RNA binding protein YcfA (HicA-like mRNA interferase family)
MSKLPQVSGQEVVRALQKIGFTVRRQQGSHIVRSIGELCAPFCDSRE